MKIFGNADVQGRLAADTGSFKVYGIQSGDEIPSVYVAGTDAIEARNEPTARSVVGHGQFDYVVSSQNSGDTFNPAQILEPGSVMGFRVQHVNPTTIYTLRTEKNRQISQQASTIDVSNDGGNSFKNAYKLPAGIVAFDMFWINEDEAYVVGGYPGNTPSNGIDWLKFSQYGITVRTTNGNTSQQRPIVFKKELGSTQFVEWGAAIQSQFDAATAIAIKPDNPNVILIGTERGLIFKSTNGGATWSQVANFNATINRIKFVTGNSDIVYCVGAFATIKKSTSAGDINSWETVQLKTDEGKSLSVFSREKRFPSFNDILVPTQTDVLIVGDDHTKILKSSDSALTWKFVPTGIYEDFFPVENAKSLKIGPNTYYALASENKLFISISPVISTTEQTSVDWIEYSIPDGILDLHLISDKNLDADNENAYAYILTKTGIYEFSFKEYSLSSKYDFTSVVSDDPVMMHVHAHSEVYVITKNAKIIRGIKYYQDFDFAFRNPLYFTEEFSGLQQEDLNTIHSAKTGRIFAGSTAGKIIFKETGSILDENLYSTDPVTWIETSEFPNISGQILQLQALDNSTVFALTEDTESLDVSLFKTEDAGNSWVNIYTYPTNIKKFIALDTNNIYALSFNGEIIYYTEDAFTTTDTFSAISNITENKYANSFDIDDAKKTDNIINFLLGGSYGVNITDLTDINNLGPWKNSSWALMSIAGEFGYSYWIGGGTTFAIRGTSGDPTDPGSEPILLISSDGGEVWGNAVPRITDQEPPETNGGGGDFAITSISEGQFYVQFVKDTFNVYSSIDEAKTFNKTNSNLFRENKKYSGNLDGIRKIRFYDSNFGAAVGNIKQTEFPNNESKISVTFDGGTTWDYVSVQGGGDYTYNSVFITTQSFNLNTNKLEYELYASAYLDGRVEGGVIFKSNDSGNSWKKVLTLPASSNGLTYQIKDIYFVNAQTGSISIHGAINTTPAVEGLYRTVDGGQTWSFINIENFAANATRGHLQFITINKGYAAGAYGSSYSSGLFKTVNAGESWDRIITPYDSDTNKPVSALHFLTEAVGVIAIENEIWKTVDSGSTWNKVHTLSYSGIINEIKFSSNGKIGIAVGHYSANNTVVGEHYILKTLDSGSNWVEVDSNHNFVNLEFSLDSSRNLIGQPSTLYSIAFGESIQLSDESTPTVTPDPLKPKENCFGIQFTSASFYNFGNFAYKCNPAPNKLVYYPNFANNIGLGRRILGQLSGVPLDKLTKNITYGAALGVNVLGKAEFSKADTAAGFGAMDSVKNAKNNVAIGYKALSFNSQDVLNRNNNSAVNTSVTSNAVGVSLFGEILTSNDGGNSWVIDSYGPFTGSYNSSSYSGSFIYTGVYNTSKNDVFILANNISSSNNTKTVVEKYNTVTKTHNTIYSSSLYTINKLSVITPSVLCAIDIENNVFLKSNNGGYSFTTGSILNVNGNSITSFKMLSENSGIIVGSDIWKLQSGSKTTWETSSYSGSHILNAVDYINSNTWIAVGTSGSIYKSIDNGLNWNFINTGLSSVDLYDVASIGSTIVAVGESGSIFISRNSGVSWNTGSFIAPWIKYNTFNTIIPIDSNTIYVRGQGSLVKTSNGGKLWGDAPLSIQVSLGFENNDNYDGIYLQSIAVNRYSAEQPDNVKSNIGIDKRVVGASTEAVVQTNTQPSEIVDENVAIGSYALYQFENSSKMIAIGANALRNIKTNINKSSLSPILDTPSGQGSSMNDLIVGTSSIEIIPTYGQIAIGAYAQNRSENSAFNTSVGYASLYDSINTNYNTAVGFYSQHIGNNSRNTSVGAWALGLNGNLNKFILSYSHSINGGDDNIAIGFKTLLNNLESERAKQIIEAGNSSAYSVIPIIGSRNIAIGNYSFLNASGSIDTVAIGYRALSDKGYDLTDSVFIGSYVGQNFSTKIGTFYSSSDNNDWKYTQTVAVGSRTLQNHTGYDIVAIGANALRGTQEAASAVIPDIPITTGDYGVLAIGMFNGNILTRTDFSDLTQKKWSNSNYVKKQTDTYFIYDELDKKWEPNTETSRASSVSIASKNTAYAVISQLTKNGTTYPLLVRTDNLVRTNGRDDIEWNVVQPGLIQDFGIAKISTAQPFILNTPDENTFFMLMKRMNPSTGNGSDVSIVAKTTTFDNFTFSSILSSDSTYRFNDMHFSSPLNGIVIGNNRVSYTTQNGGSSWSNQNIDQTNSGSGVDLYSVWMNEAGTVAYAAGNYGSIYKSISGSTWVKQLGASNSTKLTGNFWDNVTINNTTSVVDYYATLDGKYQNNIYFTDIKFLNDLFGMAVGTYADGGITNAGRPSGRKLLVAKTTDGGETWTPVTIGLPAFCPPARSVNGSSAADFFGELTLVDENTAIIGMSYGQIGFTNDGGSTWNFTESHYKTVFKTNQVCGCNPYPITYCGDYKKFGGITTIRQGAVYQDIIQVVTVGSDAQPKLTAVNDNVAIGYKVQFDGSGSSADSVQIGSYATFKGNTIVNTVAIGRESLPATDYSFANTAVGTNTFYRFQAFQNGANYPSNILNGNNNGASEFEFTSSRSEYNTSIGFESGYSLLMGDANTFVGYNAGGVGSNKNIPTYGYNNTVIGANASKTLLNVSNQIAIGNILNNTAVLWGQYDDPNGWQVYSDGRDKADTASFTTGLSFIRELNAKEFKWDSRAMYPSASGSPDGTYKYESSSYGFIAQDVEAAAIAAGLSTRTFVTNASASYYDKSGSFDIKLISPGMINVMTYNAVKELDEIIRTSKFTINLGNGTASIYPVTHSLNTRDVVAMVYNNITNIVVYPTMSIDTQNTMTITFNTPPMPNEYRLVVMK